jgi:hypothetical protein
MTQRDMLRELVRRLGKDEEAVVREYARAERAGRVVRKSDRYGTDAEAYARALWRDALKKGWLRGA